MLRYIVIIIVFIVMAGLGVLFYFMFGPWSFIGIKEEKVAYLAEKSKMLIENPNASMATEDDKMKVNTAWHDVEELIVKIQLDPRQRGMVENEFNRVDEIIGEMGTAVSAATNAREKAAKDMKSAEEARKNLADVKKERDAFTTEYGKKWGLSMLRPPVSQNFEVKFTD